VVKRKLAQIEFSSLGERDGGISLLVQIWVAVKLGVQIEADIIAPAAATWKFEEYQKLYFNPYLWHVCDFF